MLRGVWDVRPPHKDFERLAIAANEWAANHHWPTLSILRRDTFCVVLAELGIDLTTGASDDFLRQQIRCFLSTTMQAFEWLTNRFPEHVTWHPAI